MPSPSPLKVAVLDDFQGVSADMADWSGLAGRAEVTVFRDHVNDRQALIRRLAPFDVLCVMRERTPLPRAVLEALPNLKLIVSTGRRNPTIDAAYAEERHIPIKNTGYASHGAMELTWALILAALRHVPAEVASMRAGGWQTGVGIDLNGKTLGVVGLGKIGGRVAKVGRAFDMKVVAWSPNLTAEAAAEQGAQLVGKDELFATADIVTLHLVLGERSRGVVGRAELARMKPTAWLVNTSRGPLVDEAALIEALQNRRIRGAALDVYDIEPLPAEHPFRRLDNVLPSPHVGFVTEATYRIFYGDTVKAIAEWLDQR